jgi:antitoxin HicB
MRTTKLRLDDFRFEVRRLAPRDGGGFLIEYPDVPGCIADGETPEEALANGRDALRSVLLTKLEFGDPLPKPHGRARRKTPELDVRTVRARTGLSQAEFARRYRFSVRTLQDWEQGRSKPDAAVRAYLTVIGSNPEIVSTALAS